jgi:hypothetical protein
MMKLLAGNILLPMPRQAAAAFLSVQGKIMTQNPLESERGTI